MQQGKPEEDLRHFERPALHSPLPASPQATVVMRVGSGLLRVRRGPATLACAAGRYPGSEVLARRLPVDLAHSGFVTRPHFPTVAGAAEALGPYRPAPLSRLTRPADRRGGHLMREQVYTSFLRMAGHAPLSDAAPPAPGCSMPRAAGASRRSSIGQVVGQAQLAPARWLLAWIHRMGTIVPISCCRALLFHGR